MTTLRKAAQQALEALEKYRQMMFAEAGCRWDGGDAAITALEAALAQEQAVTDDMRSAVRWAPSSAYWSDRLREFFGPDAREGIDALERRLAEPDLSRCPQCNGPADNGHDRSIPPSPYLCTKCMAEPTQEQAEPKSLPCPTPKTCREHCCGGWCGPRAEPAQEQAEPTQEPVAWLQPKTVDGYSRPDLGYETCSKTDYGAFAVHTAPPRRTMMPLTAQQLDGVIERHVGGSEITDDVYASMEQFARAIEKASWEKNHG